MRWVESVGASGGSVSGQMKMVDGPVVTLAWGDGADQSVGLPAYQSDGAAGADLRANFGHAKTEMELAPGQRVLVPTGLSMEIPEGYEVQIRPRSGLALKYGVTLINTPGTIDSDYRGLIGVIMVNLGQTSFVVTHGMRIAQMVVAPVARARFAVADSLGTTGRGGGGFGSTGV